MKNGHTPALNNTANPGQKNDLLMPLWAIEKEAMENTIRQCSGNVVKAAAFLEVSPSTIYRKMRGWGIEL